MENLFFSPGVFFGGGQSVATAGDRSPWQGLFSFFVFVLVFIFFLVVCIPDVLRHLVGAEVGCN